MDFYTVISKCSHGPCVKCVQGPALQRGVSSWSPQQSVSKSPVTGSGEQPLYTLSKRRRLPFAKGDLKASSHGSLETKGLEQTSCLVQNVGCILCTINRCAKRTLLRISIPKLHCSTLSLKCGLQLALDGGGKR